jgi:hypothetical protein
MSGTPTFYCYITTVDGAVGQSAEETSDFVMPWWNFLMAVVDTETRKCSAESAKMNYRRTIDRWIFFLIRNCGNMVRATQKL